jgi:thymidylate synthase ThyX
MYNAKILLDSISETGKRLTTFEVTFPRIVLAEWNTHRMFSRNSASSRAIPVNVMIDRVLENPFVPEKFPANYKGMQPNEYWEEGDYKYKLAKKVWLNACSSAIDYVQQLTADGANGIKVHKQIANRLLEPFMWHTVICTATEFDNFFKLRTNEQAQYEIRRIADLMYKAYHAWDSPVNLTKAIGMSVTKIFGKEWEAVETQKLKTGEWHLPLIYEEDYEAIHDYLASITPDYNDNSYDGREFDNLAKKVSVARCARVSYLTHDGKRDIEKDLELFERLRTSGHWSPMEHIATPYFEDIVNSQDPKIENLRNGINEGFELYGKWINKRSGNFIGWRQWRQDFPDNNCTYFRKNE